MEKKQRYFYGKNDKLKSRKIIDQLFIEGKNFSIFPFKVIWLPENKEGLLQTGIGVSSRHFKKATDRNRIKRLMREAYRLQKNELQISINETTKALSVFIIYIDKELPGYELIYKKMGEIIKRLLKLVNDKDEAMA